VYQTHLLFLHIQPEFNGQGAIIQMETDDVIKEYNRIRGINIPLQIPLIILR